MDLVQFGCQHMIKFGFCSKYNLDVKPVVKPESSTNNFKMKEAYRSWKIFNSEFLNGLKVQKNSIIKTIEIIEEKKLRKKNKFSIKD